MKCVNNLILSDNLIIYNKRPVWELILDNRLTKPCKINENPKTKTQMLLSPTPPPSVAENKLLVFEFWIVK